MRQWAAYVLGGIAIAALLVMKMTMEHMTSEEILRSVDPRFGQGGLLIPIVNAGGGDGRQIPLMQVNFGGWRLPAVAPSRPVEGEPIIAKFAGEDDGGGNVGTGSEGDVSTGGDGDVGTGGEGGGGRVEEVGGGFAGKSYCAAYSPGRPLPFRYGALKLDGTEGGIETRGDALVQNKKLLNDEMAAQAVPGELRPLIMAFAMIETPDLSLDQISDYMRSKTLEQGRCFGIMNVNFGHRSHLGLDKELSTDALNAKTDQYYNSKDAGEKQRLTKEIMAEEVKVFRASFVQLGIYCTVLYHRGGPTLFNDPDFKKYAHWHPQIFLDSAANTYKQLVADAALMTDNRRVWYNVKEI